MKFLLSIAVIAVVTASNTTHAANYCGELANAYGPFDYTKSESAPNLRMVEPYHFPPEVERLIKGTTGTLGGDLDYTLRAFPNHSRALASLAKLALRDKTTRVHGTKWSVECYFNRAIRFRPDDAAVRNVYGSYLFKVGRLDDAIQQFTEAITVEPENAIANNNLGLIYFQKKEYDKALVFAKKADALGFPFPGLKNKLIEMGKW